MAVSEKIRDFVLAYNGDVVEAMMIAGFAGEPATLKMRGEKYLKEPHIQEALKKRDLFTHSKHAVIANRQERQAFWTSIMRNHDPDAKPEYNDKGIRKPEENIPLATRLKASELLGKSEVDFVEKIDVNAQVTITDIIKQSYIDDTPLDVIEAQYKEITNTPLTEESIEDLI